MTKRLRRLHETPWREALLAIASALIGLFAQPAAEAIVAPIFQVQNLPTIVFFMTCALFLISATYTITLSNAAHRRAQETFNRVDDLARSIGVRLTFVSAGPDAPKRVYPWASHLIRDAKKEILVLDYVPLTEAGDRARYEPEIRVSSERRAYYEEIQHRLEKEPLEGFRYRRIIQIPRGYHLASVVSKDPVLQQHCQTLAVIGARQPEFASLKTCEPFYEGTIIIIDQRHIMLEIDALDPDSREYYMRGAFLFDDPVGELISQFRRFFDRIDANAVLVRMPDLELSEEVSTSTGH
jgi:hypothetical protein